MELRARLNMRPTLTRWLLGLAVAVVPRLSTAAANQLEVFVDCNPLHVDARAAFEARTRAELAVRGLSGTVSLECGSQAQLRWAPSSAPERSVELAVPGLDEHVLMEALAELLGERLPPPNDVTAAPTPVDDSTPKGANAPPAGPGEPVDRNGTSRAEPASDESAGSTAATPSTEPTDGNATPTANAAPKSDATAPQETRSVEDVHPAHDPDSNARKLSWSLRAGLPASLLVRDVALGIQLGASIHLRPRMALLVEASAQQVVTPIEDYTLRVAEFRVGAAIELFEPIAGYASLGAGWVLIEAPAGRALAPSGGPCQFSGRAGSCGFLAGSVGVQWEIGRGPLQPQLAAQIDWNHRELPIDETGTPGTTRRTVTIPYVRPAVIFRIAWLGDSQ